MAQSPFQKLNFSNSNKKVCFPVISNFSGFLYFVSNVLSGIVWANKYPAKLDPVSSKLQFSNTFSFLQTLINIGSK